MPTPPSVSSSYSYDGNVYGVSVNISYSSASAIDIEVSRNSGYIKVYNFNLPYTTINFSNMKSETTHYFRARITLSGVTSDWSSYTSVTTPAYPTSLPTDYYPPYKPQVTHQWVWNVANNTWSGEADNCVATSIATMKEIHEKRERGTSYLSYSIGWIYGNRIPTDLLGEGMVVEQALNNLKANGVPQWNLLPENSLRYYPDNYYYYDNVVGTYNSTPVSVGARTLVENNKNTSSITNDAIKQKIDLFTQYGSNDWTGTQNGFGKNIIENIKQRIISDGTVLLSIGMPPAFDQLTVDAVGYISTGYVPDTFSSTIRGFHAVNILGWKLVNGKTYWIIHNNWGATWGDSADAGRAYIPIEWDYIYSFYTVLDYVDPSIFAWSITPVSGGFLNIATDWNSLTSKINLKRVSKGLSTIAFTNVVAGETILTTSIVNEAINGFTGLTYSDSLPSLQIPGNPIYANFFIALQNCYNSIT